MRMAHEHPGLDEYNFVTCPSFHGATLIALLLNNHSQLMTLGDLIPEQMEDRMCACGEGMDACKFWTGLTGGTEMEQPFTFPSLPPLMKAARPNMYANYAVSQLARIFGAKAWKLCPGARDEFLTSYHQLHARSCELTGARKFIDGSKNPVKARALNSMLTERKTIRILHITRDPRAFIASCRKYNDISLEINMRYYRRYHRFILKQYKAGSDYSYLHIRLEDLCREPDLSLEKIQTFLGVEPEPLTVPVRHPEKHHLVGNTRAIARFDGQLKLDTRYLDTLTEDEQQTIIKLAGSPANTFDYQP